MDNSSQLSPLESLNVISKAIGQTKENIKEQSFYYIIWGWLISAISFAHYLVLLFTDLKYYYLPWIIVMPIGWIASSIYAIKKEKALKYETHLDVFLKTLWIVIGVSFIVISLMSFYLKVNPISFILLLAGIGTLVSGLMMKFKPLAIGGIVFFICSLVSLFVDNTETLLVNGIAIVLGYLIPAYLLKKAE